MSLALGDLLGAVLALVAVWFVSVLARRALARYGRRAGTNAASLYTVSRLVHYVLLAVGVLLALELAGIPVGKFTVFAGALGVGLGFGLQAIFNNFVSGLILLFDKSLKVGDFVELDAELRGTVRDINIRATRITTNDNIDILVPNSEFVSGRVVNWTHRETRRRLRVPFAVAYGVDKERVKKAALEAASRVPFTRAMEGDDRPQVWLVGFGDSAVEFILAVWLTEEAARRNAAIKAAYLWELDTSLKEHGIEIPFPQRDLHLRSAFGLQGDDALELLRGSRGDGGGVRRPAAPAPAEAASPPMSERERAKLSGNDAQEDAQREIEREAKVAARDENDPAAPGTARD
ncbi:MAG: hypothetical protein A2190_00090 [Lysobacterales bacterium RIFOXYA1_FULL_69_10]|nr:MAG: hypothetical protein A2190_00090 [Xanthomonadales bacterium RIFOXYA1_FULL_69_10]